MTDPFHIREYRDAIEGPHSVSAVFRETVRVDTVCGQVAIEADVHVFDLEGHATVTVAYAWSQPVEGSTKRRILAMLQQGRVGSPLAAVRARLGAQLKAEEGPKDALERDLEFLRRRAAEARQRGDVEKAAKLEKGIVLIERGGKRGR